MFCTQCGAQLAEGSKFCSACGSAVRNREEKESAGSHETKARAEPAQEDSMKCYFYEGTEKKGPFSYTQMVELIEQGQISRETLVWISGSSEWVEAEKSLLAKAFGEIMPLAPISTISETWIWALAVGSVVISMLLPRIAIAARMSAGTSQMFIFIGAIIANAILLAKDMDEVKKSGRDVASWMYVGIVLVPIYLYVREKHTNKNYAPLVVWCILFILQNQLSTMIDRWLYGVLF